MPCKRRRQGDAQQGPEFNSEIPENAKRHLKELSAFLGDIQSLMVELAARPSPALDPVAPEPPGSGPSDGPITMETYTADPAFRDWLTARTADVPDGLLSGFLSLGAKVAMILKANGMRRPESSEAVLIGLMDAQVGPLLRVASQVELEAAERGDPSRGVLGLRGALWHEVGRRGVARTCVLPRTVTTLLGDDALI